MKKLTIIWDQEAWDNFYDVVHSLDIKQGMKNTLMGEAYILVSAFAEATAKHYMEKKSK